MKEQLVANLTLYLELTPKQMMWNHICVDYTPNPKPSHIAYASPNGNKPPPAIQAAIDTGDHLIFSSMIHSL